MSRIGPTLAAGPFFTLAFFVLAAYSLAATSALAVPVALALLSWFIVAGFADAIERIPGVGRRIGRTAAVSIASAILFLGALYMIRLMLISFEQLAENLTIYGNPVFLRFWYWASGVGLQQELTREALLARLAGEGGITVILGYLQSAITIISLVLLYTVFLLADEKFFAAKLARLQPNDSRRRRMRVILHEIAHETRLYLWIMTLISVGVGFLTFAACVTFGVRGAILWGFLAFALNYIPTLGSILGVLIPGAFAALTLGEDTGSLILLIAWLTVVQFIAGNVIVPTLMGDRLNLSSFVILLALAVWGAVWGPTGLFLAVPLTVILVIVFSKFETTRPIAVMLSRTGELPGGAMWTASPGRRRGPRIGPPRLGA